MEKEIEEIRFAVIALLDVAIKSESTLEEDSIKLQNQLLPLEKYIKHVKYSSVPIEQLVPRSSSLDKGSTTYELLQGGGRHTKRRKSKKARRTRRKF